MVELARGRLLVATPVLVDPNFFRTVIFLVEHSAEGAVGLVVNRPSETAVADPLPAWDDLAAPPAVVFVGGPVAPEVAICLVRLAAGEYEGLGLETVGPGLATMDLSLDPDLLRPYVTDLRIFSGYAGWGPGQLETEIEEGAWIVAASHPDDVHNRDPEGLWRAVLRRQPGPIAFLANHPVDVRSN